MASRCDDYLFAVDGDQIDPQIGVGGAEDVLLGQVVAGDHLEPEQSGPLVRARGRHVAHDAALGHD